ncbi:MAG: hypothetical protein U0746_19025 [Gemmataceae bacterium]
MDRFPSAIAVATLLLAGCNDGPKVVKVVGTLTYKGQPVTNAILQFRPEKGRQTWAQTDEQGRFKVNYDKTQDGAVLGKHKVWLEFRPQTAAEQDAVMQGKRPAMSKEMRVLFDKYGAEKSTLTVDITPDTKDLKLDLE